LYHNHEAPVIPFGVSQNTALAQNMSFLYKKKQLMSGDMKTGIFEGNAEDRPNYDVTCKLQCRCDYTD